VGSTIEPKRRLRHAVDLVLADVAAVLVADAVAVVLFDELDHPDVTALVDSDPEVLSWLTRDHSDIDGVVLTPGEPGSVGLTDRHAVFADLVAHTAEIVQEVIMESRRNRGAAFPTCPEHPNTPLWSTVIDREAVWRCIDGGTTVIPIGAITSR
jgi:hypothetical protein